MKPSEMSDEELVHWISIAKDGREMYEFPDVEPGVNWYIAKTIGPCTRYTFHQLAQEAARRLTAKSDWIPRPIEEVAGALKYIEADYARETWHITVVAKFPIPALRFKAGMPCTVAFCTEGGEDDAK